GYRKEIFIKHQMRVGDFLVTIQGRIDGVYEKDGAATVEEIKSVVIAPSQFAQLESKNYPIYCAQLQIYCYFLQQSGYRQVRGCLVFVNVVDSSKWQIEV